MDVVLGELQELGEGGGKVHGQEMEDALDNEAYSIH